MKSTAPVSRAMSIEGAVSCAVWIRAPFICGRQVVYQMVPSWEVHFAPARSAREVAFAYLLFCFVMQTMLA